MQQLYRVVNAYFLILIAAQCNAEDVSRNKSRRRFNWKTIINQALLRFSCHVVLSHVAESEGVAEPKSNSGDGQSIHTVFPD
jgi:hypothetical protein